jgi:hypothetical protein
MRRESTGHRVRHAELGRHPVRDRMIGPIENDIIELHSVLGLRAGRQWPSFGNVGRRQRPACHNDALAGLREVTESVFGIAPRRERGVDHDQVEVGKGRGGEPGGRFADTDGKSPGVAQDASNRTRRFAAIL